MKPWAEMTTGARSLRAGGIAAVIAAILWGIWSQRDAAAPDDASQTASPSENSTDQATAGADPAATAPAVEEAPAAPTPAAPKLDVVRVTRDGSALIAGMGVPGASLSLRVDGTEVISVPADANGNFVGMFNLPPSDQPRQLSILMILPDGTELPAADSIAIAPTTAPAALADAGGATSPADGDAAAPATEGAEDAPAALLVTEQGAKVLQGIGDAGVTAANVTVDAITYTPEGAVQLAGRGVAGAGVRLYLDNAPAGDTTVAADGSWALTLSDTAPGIYNLRADQIDAAGKVTSRFETPFKRESLAALAAATGSTAAPDADQPDAETTATAADAADATDGATQAADGADAAAQPDAAAGDAASTADAGTTETAAQPDSDTASAAPAPDASAPEVPAADAPADTQTAAGAATTQAAAPTAPVQVTVQPGYSLWRIARENLGDGILYVQVFEANKTQIRDPDLIYPGQIFTLPAQD